MKPHKTLMLSAFQAALDAVDPLKLVPSHLPDPPQGRTLVVGGGKAAASMALAVENHWPQGAPLSGLVVTRYAHSLPLLRIKVVEASHPLPDGRGADAAASMLAEIKKLTPDDLLLVLLSGGGSSLLALPVDGVTLKELRAVTRALLACGAQIQDINTVRKHLTQFSGGRVAALIQAPVRALILSDVVGDNPTHIASGPCAPDPGTYADALDILRKHGIEPPLAVSKHLLHGQHGEIADTPKPGDPLFARANNHIIGSARDALNAARNRLESSGMTVIDLGEIEGEARILAHAHADLIRSRLVDTSRPFALLSGGEAIVTLRQTDGRGGRNTEYLLAVGIALSNVQNLWALACDTDGIDGTEDNAGAVWMSDTLERACAAELDATACLDANNSYGYFKKLDNLVITGPTRTNVNDFRLILVA